MFPMSPLQSWAFLILIGVTIFAWVSYFIEKMEEDVWNERIKEDEDIDF